jgi:hypothetical protein
MAIGLVFKSVIEAKAFHKLFGESVGFVFWLPASFSATIPSSPQLQRLNLLQICSLPNWQSLKKRQTLRCVFGFYVPSYKFDLLHNLVKSYNQFIGCKICRGLQGKRKQTI